VSLLLRGSFQYSADRWARECFPPEVVNDKVERALRLLEEAMELAQASGVTQDHAERLVRYTFSRPVGDVQQEVGGVMVTLAVLCNAHEVDMTHAGWAEFDRIDKPEIMDCIRQKQVTKRIATGYAPASDPVTLFDEIAYVDGVLSEHIEDYTPRDPYLDGIMHRTTPKPKIVDISGHGKMNRKAVLGEGTDEG
jgi:NTP pyrophosphatase (non-canonical NTP hydrolase)